ncbi:MAG: nuclear transport factor 2 family protein [Pseudomonadota bacterium]
MTYTLEQLSDLEAIREAARRYCRGVDRLDAPLMKSAYWADATDDHGGFKGNAHDFVDLCMTAHLKWEATGHCIFNHSIELSADQRSARGEIYNMTWLRGTNHLDTWYGRYLDRYEKRGVEWRIIERVCVHEATHTQTRVPMDIDSDPFRQGSFDRATPGRPLGP